MIDPQTCPHARLEVSGSLWCNECDTWLTEREIGIVVNALLRGRTVKLVAEPGQHCNSFAVLVDGERVPV
jgi:hypothetical protein